MAVSINRNLPVSVYSVYLFSRSFKEKKFLKASFAPWGSLQSVEMMDQIPQISRQVLSGEWTGG